MNERTAAHRAAGARDARGFVLRSPVRRRESAQSASVALPMIDFVPGLVSHWISTSTSF